MSVREFINKHIPDWNISLITTCGTVNGVIKMVSPTKTEFVKIFFNLNGSSHYTDDSSTVRYCEYYCNAE